MIRYRKSRLSENKYARKSSRRLYEYKRGDGGIKIPGYKGSWYVISQIDYVNPKTKTLHTFSLLEHEFYGDEAANLLVDDFGNVVIEGYGSAKELLDIAIDDDDFDY